MTRGQAAPKTFAAHSRDVLGDLLAGVSQADAAVNHGLSERTIKRWLAKGRSEPGGAIWRVRRAGRQHIDREFPPNDERPIDDEELLLLVSRLGRKGNVRPLALARDIWPSARPWQEPDPFADLDPVTDGRRRTR